MPKNKWILRGRHLGMDVYTLGIRQGTVAAAGSREQAVYLMELYTYRQNSMPNFSLWYRPNEPIHKFSWTAIYFEVKEALKFAPELMREGLPDYIQRALYAGLRMAEKRENINKKYLAKLEQATQTH